MVGPGNVMSKTCYERLAGPLLRTSALTSTPVDMGSLISIPSAPGPAIKGADLETLVVTPLPLSSEQEERLRPYFKNIISYTGKEIPEDGFQQADAIFGFLPPVIERRDQAPRLKLVQLASAGADRVLESPFWKDVRKAGEEVILTTASGMSRVSLLLPIIFVEGTGYSRRACRAHTASSYAPLIVGSCADFGLLQWFIATTLSLYHKLHEQIIITQVGVFILADDVTLYLSTDRTTMAFRPGVWCADVRPGTAGENRWDPRLWSCRFLLFIAVYPAMLFFCSEYSAKMGCAPFRSVVKLRALRRPSAQIYLPQIAMASVNHRKVT
jgi:hypothetical protein